MAAVNDNGELFTTSVIWRVCYLYEQGDSDKTIAKAVSNEYSVDITAYDVSMILHYEGLQCK